MKVFFLTRNFSRYVSGYYHTDWLRAWQQQTELRPYGPGYAGYNPTHSLDEALESVGWTQGDVDIIVISTTWEDQRPSSPTTDPHPALNLSQSEGPLKVFYLNKEYKRCEEKIRWANEQRIDLVCTSVPEVRQAIEEAGLNYLSVPFAVDPLRLRVNPDRPRKWDLQFTGHLHRTHLDDRWMAKTKIFLPKHVQRYGLIHRPNRLSRSKVNDWAQSSSIYWAEWETRRQLLGARVKHGNSYFRLLALSRAAIATKSAVGIVGPRFFELMASGSVAIVPVADDKNGLLNAGLNCVEAGTNWDYLPEVVSSLKDERHYKALSDSARDWVSEHTYVNRVNAIINHLAEMYPDKSLT